MAENFFLPVSFIAGPAILTNACAIIQNGATTRYNLAITQWRDFRSSQAARDDRLSTQYAKPQSAVALAEQRIRLLLRGLGLLNAAVALFASTTVLGLAGTILVEIEYFPARLINLVMLFAGTTGLLLLLAATVTLLLESACGKALMDLHLQRGRTGESEPRPRRRGGRAPDPQSNRQERARIRQHGMSSANDIECIQTTDQQRSNR